MIRVKFWVRRAAPLAPAAELDRWSRIRRTSAGAVLVFGVMALLSARQGSVWIIAVIAAVLNALVVVKATARIQRASAQVGTTQSQGAGAPTQTASERPPTIKLTVTRPLSSADLQRVADQVSANYQGKPIPEVRDALAAAAKQAGGTIGDNALDVIARLISTGEKFQVRDRQ